MPNSFCLPLMLGGTILSSLGCGHVGIDLDADESSVGVDGKVIRDDGTAPRDSAGDGGASASGGAASVEDSDGVGGNAGALNHVSTAGVDLHFLADGRIELYSQISMETTRSPPNTIPEGKWFCLTVHALVSGTGLVEVSVDEQTVVSESPLDTRPASGIDRIVYGIAETGPLQSGATIFLDDLVVSTQPVSCAAL